MSEEYCPVGDMPKEWCAHCRKIKAPEEEAVAEEEAMYRNFDSWKKP